MDSDIKNSAPVMDVAPPPPATADELPPHMPPEPQNDVSDKPPAPPVETKAKPVPDAPKSGVALAIVATVIIVLALAALATYAYLKQR